MKARVIITPEGQLSAFIDEGTFEEGKARLEALLQALTGAKVPIIEAGKVEQHKHDNRHVHLVGHDHDHLH